MCKSCSKIRRSRGFRRSAGKTVCYSLLVFHFSFLLASCAEDVEKAAGRFLSAARTAYAAGRFDEAKAQIDSIKVVCPKAFEARKEGIALMRSVELAEARRTYAYTDSLLAISVAHAEELTPRFHFEKDERYQEVGLYCAPSQRLERNAQRSYLRATVDEHGRMTLTSFWRGAKYNHHHAVRVTAGGTFAETPVSADTYESSDALAKTERNDFVPGETDGGVTEFIRLHAGESVKLEFLGDKPVAATLTAADTRAISDVYELSKALQAVRKLSTMQDETARKIAFIEKNIEKEPTE